jgi:hypothetical protein
MFFVMMQDSSSARMHIITSIKKIIVERWRFEGRLAD